MNTCRIHYKQSADRRSHPQTVRADKLVDDGFRSDGDSYVFQHGTIVVAVVSKDIVALIEKTGDETSEQAS